jgi:hypothetical protein
VCRQFALGDVPATIPVENLSAAMALVSLDSLLRGIHDSVGLPRHIRISPEPNWSSRFVDVC